MRTDKQPLCLLSGTGTKRISTNNASADKFIGLDVDLVDVIAMAVKHAVRYCSVALAPGTLLISGTFSVVAVQRTTSLPHKSPRVYSVRRSRIQVS